MTNSKIGEMTVDKTYVPKGQLERQWVLVDAGEQILGRVATVIANHLMGKNKPTFTPGVETGDYVVVINAKNVRVTGKRLDEKFYYSHSGYPGGLKSIGLRELLRTRPERAIRAAVWGMLPHNKMGHKLIKNLHIYADDQHPHQAQNPQPTA
jgi:large subunit ribosomal protein L13